MSAKNLSWFFNVEYFERAFDGGAEMSASNKTLQRAKPEIFAMGRIPEQKSFDLQVEYPGLMTGVGYPHAAGIEGEICAGCSLDYVTGLPYIPGSSVKGLLRSAFAHKGYIKELLEDEEADVRAIEKEIFENSDIFLDVFPVDGMCNGVLEIENITPHHNTPLGALAEPTPLTFVKVKPGVVYRFAFVFKNNVVLSAEKKLELFKQIILDLGIGAKTNVGFGRLTDEIKPVKPIKMPDNEETQKPAAPRYEEGKCRDCGKPTKKNPKTDKWYPYCFECNQKRNKQ